MVQPLSFVDSSYKEPSASAGSDLQVQNGLILRPRIGGFYPSIMRGVVEGGQYLAPLVAITGRKMFTRKSGGGKKEDWARNRERARAELERYGNPSGVNVNKYAAYVRKNSRAAAAFLDEFRDRKLKAKAPKKAAIRKEAQVNNDEAMKEYKKLMSRRKPRSPPSPVPEKTRKVAWANQLKAAAETIKQYEKAHPGIKRTKGNFTTLASLRRRGLNDRDFFDRYSSPAEAPSPPTRKNKNRFSPYRNQAAATLRNLKKKYPEIKRRAGNFMTLGKLIRDGDLAGQEQFLKSYRVADTVAAPATTAAATAATVAAAPNTTRRKYTRNEYWNAFRKAGENLKTQGIAKPRPENKRKLLESRRLGLNNGEVFRTMAGLNATAAPSVAAATTRKKSPVRNENKQTAKARLLSLGPVGAAGPSAAQTLQFARMIKNGRNNSIERFLRNYAAKKAATLAKK
jgi:hypothetical protein